MINSIETLKKATPLISAKLAHDYSSVEALLIKHGIAPFNSSDFTIVPGVFGGRRHEKFFAVTSKRSLLFVKPSSIETAAPTSNNSVIDRSFSRRFRRFEGSGFFSLNSFGFTKRFISKTPQPHIFATRRYAKKVSYLPIVRSAGAAVYSSRIARDWASGFSKNPSITVAATTLSVISGTTVNIRRVPAFSLARYAVDLDGASLRARRKAQNQSFDPVSSRPTSTAFLQHLSDERRGRFQYVAVQIPDLLRIAFVARYFKKATLLAQLFALTLAALPRNRKETQFLRFLRKVVKVFAAQRPERLGVRLRFQGRVNR